jgi:hypothetical protein
LPALESAPVADLRNQPHEWLGKVGLIQNQQRVLSKHARIQRPGFK